MPYRLEDITAAERTKVATLLLAAEGEYGLVTGLARELGTSRQFLYDLRDRARTALTQAVAPGRAGRPAQDERLVIDRHAVARDVVVLSQVAHASVRGIQECLEEMVGVERSVGWIEGVLQEAGRRAEGLVAVPEGPRQVAADEVYAGGQPVLEVVEPRSGLILTLDPAPCRDETAWGCAWLDLEERGVEVDGVVADGAEGLRAGARAAGLPEPRLDHWHTLRDLGRIAHVLETEAYRRLAAAERAKRATTEAAYRAAHGRGGRRGRPLGGATDPATVRAVVQAAAEAMARADGTAAVLATVREALRPVDPASGQVRTRDAVAGDLRVAAARLRELGGRATEAATLVEARVPGLTAYLDDLDRALAGPRAVLPEATVRFIAWAWRHQQALGLQADDVAALWPAAPAAARWVWAALDGVVRASGMVENLNSALDPHRAAHRGLPWPILAVWRVYRNHRVFPRGKRADHSPLDLSGLAAPHWLDALGYGRLRRSTTTAEFPARPARSVNTLAA